MKIKKDINKALMLSLFPGLGFLYLGNVKYFMMFLIITFLPLIGISTMGSQAILGSLVMYAVSIYYTNTLVQDTQRHTIILKKDPLYILCLSFLLDGWGQVALGQKGKGMLMMCSGLTSCMSCWVVLITKNGFLDMLLQPEGQLFMIVNFMVTWTMVAVAVKIVSLIDAYYSTYHLYVAKK